MQTSAAPGAPEFGNRRNRSPNTSFNRTPIRAGRGLGPVNSNR